MVDGKALKNLVEKCLDKLALACAGAAALGMISIVGIIVSSVVMRKFANSPLHFTEELVGLLLSVSLFLGLPMVTLKAKHVRVSIVVGFLKGQWRTALKVVSLCVGIVFFSWLIIEAIPWLEFAIKRNLKTETTRILLFPWMALLPLSLFLTCLILLARLLGIIDPVDNDNYESDSLKSNETL